MIIRAKACTKCGEAKPVIAFCRDSKAPDHLSWSCKACLNESSRKWHAANRERVKERIRAWHQKNRPDEVARAAAVERTRQWCEQNPEKLQASRKNRKHTRRARERGGMTATELRAWLNRQPKICHWCGIACERYDIDHLTPLAKGGAHQAHNLVVSCPTCNRKKGARCPVEFAQSLGKAA